MLEECEQITDMGFIGCATGSNSVGFCKMSNHMWGRCLCWHRDTDLRNKQLIKALTYESILRKIQPESYLLRVYKQLSVACTLSLFSFGTGFTSALFPLSKSKLMKMLFCKFHR